MPLSVVVAVIEGHKVIGKQNLLGLFLADFSVDQNEIIRGVKAVQTKHSDTDWVRLI